MEDDEPDGPGAGVIVARRAYDNVTKRGGADGKFDIFDLADKDALKELLSGIENQMSG